MKHLFILSILLSANVFSFGQCNPYFDFETGSTWETTNYSASEKMISRQVNEIKSIEENSNGWIAEVNMKSFNKKDKLDFEKDISMTCDDGNIKMDMTRFFPEEMLASFKEMNMELEIDNIQIPAELKVGDQLKNASIKISGDLPMTFETVITDREVVSKESITTPAGTFDCFKITYKVVSKSIMTIEMKGIDWVAKGVGMVKSENYNKNGKLSGISLLTSFE